MKTDQHTVTIPIADYNELMETKSLAGVTKLDEQSTLFDAIRTAMYQQQRYNNPSTSLSIGDAMKGIELFIRIS